MQHDVTHQIFPYCIWRGPGEALLFAYRPTRGALAIPAIISTLDRIHRVGSKLLAYEEIVKETAGHDALGDRIVRELSPREIAYFRLILYHASPPTLFR